MRKRKNCKVTALHTFQIFDHTGLLKYYEGTAS
jgi:hypothetical protein